MRFLALSLVFLATACASVGGDKPAAAPRTCPKPTVDAGAEMQKNSTHTRRIEALSQTSCSLTSSAAVVAAKIKVSATLQSVSTEAQQVPVPLLFTAVTADKQGLVRQQIEPVVTIPAGQTTGSTTTSVAYTMPSDIRIAFFGLKTVPDAAPAASKAKSGRKAHKKSTRKPAGKQ